MLSNLGVSVFFRGKRNTWKGTYMSRREPHIGQPMGFKPRGTSSLGGNRARRPSQPASVRLFRHLLDEAGLFVVVRRIWQTHIKLFVCPATVQTVRHKPFLLKPFEILLFFFKFLSWRGSFLGAGNEPQSFLFSWMKGDACVSGGLNSHSWMAGTG